VRACVGPSRWNSPPGEVKTRAFTLSGGRDDVDVESDYNEKRRVFSACEGEKFLHRALSPNLRARLPPLYNFLARSLCSLTFTE